MGDWDYDRNMDFGATMQDIKINSTVLLSAEQDQFQVRDTEIYFQDALSAQEYAKNNPGAIVVRKTTQPQAPIEYSAVKELLVKKTPSMILEHLSKHIISQDEAKKEIALAMYYHSLKSKFSTNEDIGTNGPIMMVGPTGSGKTFIVQKACEFIDTVYIHVDTSSMVPEGIVGYAIGDLAKEILRVSNYNIHKATHCVVFFDEMDKLFSSDSESSYGDRIANQLLRLVEGSIIKISYTHTERERLPHAIETLDSSNMQFILGGAFQWILDEKAEAKSTVGFARSITQEKNHSITLEDLYEQGIPKELLGRMNTIVNLHPLTEHDYYKILTQSESSPLKEFIKKIEFHGDKVEIQEDTLKQISKIAASSKLGVRSIKQTLKAMFKDVLFSTPEGACKTHYIECKEYPS
ncbi:AAA family ATPase [bacterium]|nr:AAA family ATPase [bacterium]MBU1994120.1 AAA family ATPase [bacterium]